MTFWKSLSCSGYPSQITHDHQWMNSLDKRLVENFTTEKLILSKAIDKTQHAKRKTVRHYVPSDRTQMKQNSSFRRRGFIFPQCMPLIPTFGRQREADYSEFQASLVYKLNLEQPVLHTKKPCLKKTKTTTKSNKTNKKRKLEYNQSIQ